MTFYIYVYQNGIIAMKKSKLEEPKNEIILTQLKETSLY